MLYSYVKPGNNQTGSDPHLRASCEPEQFLRKSECSQETVSKSKKTNKRELIKDVLQQEKDIMLEDTPRKTTTHEWESRKDFSKNS